MVAAYIVLVLVLSAKTNAFTVAADNPGLIAFSNQMKISEKSNAQDPLPDFDFQGFHLIRF